MLVQSDEGIGRAGSQVPWRLRDMGLAGAWVLAVVLFADIVLGIPFAAVDNVSDEAEIAANLGSGLALEVALVGATAWFSVRRYACGWQPLGFRPAVRGGWWVPPLLGAAVFGAAWLTLIVYLAIVHLAGLGEMMPESTLPEEWFENPFALPLLGVLAIAAAPIAEETFFRGFLFTGLRVRWGTFWAALASGLLFGAVHLNPGFFVPISVIGILLAWAYVFSGSLWTAVWAHLVFNSVSFGIGVAAGGGS